MSISPVSFHNISYNPQFKQQKNDNPISRKGEAANLTKATFLGGLALAGRLFWELIIDGDFEFNRVANKASKLVDKKHPKASNNKKLLCKIGAFAALIAAGFAGFALLYTAFKAPEIKYKSKLNTFTKGQEMDVYTKANEAERELYTQLADKANGATAEEKANLKEQYAKMVVAKNPVPDFVKLKKEV